MITTPAQNVENLRKFGLLLGAILLGLFGLFIPYMRANPLPEWPWFLAFALWTPALFYPKALSLLYKYWIKLGEVLGFINSRLILAFLFFTIITPFGLIKRLFGNDTMGKRFDKNLSTYAKYVDQKPVKHMEDPF